MISLLFTNNPFYPPFCLLFTIPYFPPSFPYLFIPPLSFLPKFCNELELTYAPPITNWTLGFLALDKLFPLPNCSLLIFELIDWYLGRIFYVVLRWDTGWWILFGYCYILLGWIFWCWKRWEILWKGLFVVELWGIFLLLVRWIVLGFLVRLIFGIMIPDEELHLSPKCKFWEPTWTYPFPL